MPVQADDDPAPATYANDDASQLRRWWLPLLLLVALAGAGYALFHYGAFDRLRTAIADATKGAKPAKPPAAAASPAAPAVAITGNYSATVADQDIALTLNADGPKPPAATSGVAHYYNKTVKRDCAAMLVPIAGDANAQGQAFDQAKIAGMTACDRTIRLRLAPADKGARLAAIWTDPATGAELMRTTLNR